MRYLLKYFPQDAEIYYNLGIVYEKLKKFPEAKECYQKAVEIFPQEDFYYNLGDVLVDLKEWDDAISAFRKVLETDPEDGNCYFNLGVCYFNKDEKILLWIIFKKLYPLIHEMFLRIFTLDLYTRMTGLQILR